MSNKSPVSVSELVAKARAALNVELESVWVEAELFQFRGPHSSGHCYFKIRDEDSILSAIIWRSTFIRYKNLKLEEGAKVLVRGSFDIYAARGDLSFIVDKVQLVGTGSLSDKFEKLKSSLKSEGLFESLHKKEIPPYPQRVAVITAKGSAACSDILSSFKNSEAPISVELFYVQVQGDSASKKITSVLKSVDETKPDVILLSRGGGSLEDLWSFNEEDLVRQIFASNTPVISAIGHEVDYTLCDFVSDLRASTPTAGAKQIVQGWVDAMTHLDSLRRQLVSLSPSEKLKNILYRASYVETKLVESGSMLIRWKREKIKRLGYSLLQTTPERCLNRVKPVAASLEASLRAASPSALLERGYALVSKKGDSQYLRSPGQVKIGDEIEIQLFSGGLSAEVK